MADGKNDIEAFRLWANSLGCPPEAIPTEEALKSVFKSPQRELFYTMMKRVRPRQEVESLRRYILLREVEKLGGKDQLAIMPASRRSFLPQQLQTYLKIKDLEKKLSESENRLEEYKKEYDSLSATLKMKNIQVIKAKQKNRVLQAKVNLLELKSESFDADIKKEEALKAHLIKYMPVKLTAENASDSAANQAIEQALKTLDAFYEFCRNNSNPNSLQTAKEELWSNLRSLFFNLPNFSLFNGIMRIKEQQLQYIMELNKKKLEDSQLRCLTIKEPMSPFDKELMRLKIDFLALVVNHSEAVQEREQIEERFYDRCTLFINEFQKKVREFNANESEERIEEVISDFLVQYNSRTFFKNQNEYIQQEIDKYRIQIEQNVKKLQNHEVILGTVKQTYNDINATINNVQQDMMQLGQIKQKIVYSQNLLKYKIHDLQVQFSSKELVSCNVGGNTVKVLVSPVAGSGDSFESGADSLLCSTKLDFDASMMASNTSISTMKRSFAFGNSTLLPCSETRSLLPPHSLELSIFAEIPLEKFSRLGSDCAFYLEPNPLVIESRELSSTLQLAPGTLLTQNGALQEVRNRIAWADLISLHSFDLKLELDSTTVDVQTYRERSKAQREHLTELLDKIEVTGICTKRTLQRSTKIYNFILDNPLRLYIPASKLFNNQTYADFESEFKMYYRMANVGPSIQ